MSYLLGYIAADGCITVSTDGRKNPYTLNITSKDKEHLQKIRTILNSSHKISEKTNGSRNGKAFQLQIRSVELTTDLILMGITPRKTSTLRSIKVPSPYFPDFVRGFFDVDGSVYIYTVNNVLQLKTSFTCASFQFLSDLNLRISSLLSIPHKNLHRVKRLGRLPCYNICFYIDDSEQLYRFMYRNNSSLYLKRKYEVFKKWTLIKRRHYIKKNYPSKIGQEFAVVS